MAISDPTRSRAAIEAMSGTLAVARALVEAGRHVDLTGLDAGAAVLCAEIAMLPPETARPMRLTLVALLEELDGLGAALSPPRPLRQAGRRAPLDP
jgi:hypothetical protein